jgi:hypothetical protein
MAIPSDLFRSQVGLAPSGAGLPDLRNGMTFVPGQNRSNNLFKIHQTGIGATNFSNLVKEDGAVAIANLQPADGKGIIKAVKLFGYRATAGAEAFLTAIQGVLIRYSFFINGKLAVPVVNNAIGVNNSDYLIIDIEFNQGDTVYLQAVNGSAVLIETVIQTYSWYY